MGSLRPRTTATEGNYDAAGLASLSCACLLLLRGCSWPAALRPMAATPGSRPARHAPPVRVTRCTPCCTHSLHTNAPMHEAHDDALSCGPTNSWARAPPMLHMLEVVCHMTWGALLATPWPQYQSLGHSHCLSARAACMHVVHVPPASHQPVCPQRDAAHLLRYQQPHPCLATLPHNRVQHCPHCQIKEFRVYHRIIYCARLCPADRD
jgi:hypothetical protein